MSAIVKANSSLTAGGLAVLKRAFNSEKEGTITYRADYACLARFANRHMARFKTGATPPTALPAELLALQLVKSPELFNLEYEIANGLAYFRASYSAESNAETNYSVTETTEQRNFSASETKTVTIGEPGFLTDVQATDNLAFDYMSVSVTYSSRGTGIFRESISSLRPQTSISTVLSLGTTGLVGRPFNIRKTRSYSGGATITGGKVAFNEDTIESSAQTRNSDGTYTYSRTVTGIYQAPGNVSFV